MRVIGDIHGKIERYLALIQGVESSVVCGDMGVGFGIEIPILGQEHGFIRGNHDDPAECKKHPNWIPDGAVKNDIMYVGGAWSIDWEYRQNYERAYGRKIWWADEEVNDGEAANILAKYLVAKPRVMITHDCPTIAAKALFSHHSWDESRTRKLFDDMFAVHRPELWVHGHHHVDRTTRIGSTTFVCLDELSFIDIKE